MSLTKLYDNQSASRPQPATRQRLSAWMLPGALVGGFCVLLAMTAGGRILPAQTVDTVPAAIFEVAGVDDSPPSDETDGRKALNGENEPGELLFQASGWIEPDPFMIHVTALESGIVERVHVLEGVAVDKGQVLVELVKEDAQLALQTALAGERRARSERHVAQAALEEARAQLASSRDELERLQRITGRAVSEQDVSRAQFALQTQEAAYNAAEARTEVAAAEVELSEVEVASARLALERMTIVAPVAGRIVELRAEPGKKAFLEADDRESAMVVMMYERGKLQARIDVSLSDAAGLFIGQPVEIATEFLPDRTFRGEVTRIVGMADLQRNTLQAKVRLLAPDDALRPEMLCRAKFFAAGSPRTTSGEIAGGSGTMQPDQTSRSGTGRVRRLVLAPVNALDNSANNHAALWIIGTDSLRLERRDVRTGRFRRDDWIEVESGLLPGERIVLPPHDDLVEGRRVRPRLMEELPS